jgi:hypothetical protein
MTTSRGHRRVGTAAVLAFLALLLLGATRGPAQADQAVPAPESAPAQPGYGEPDPGFRDRDGDGYGPPDGFGGGRHDGDGGFGPPYGDGGEPAPAPSTGGSQT